jgi:Flp pilus assembly protein TadG
VTADSWRGVVKDRRRGQALAEMSILSVGLFGFFLITFDFARVLIVFLVISHAAREGARIAAVEGKTPAQVSTAAKQSVAPWLAPANVIVLCKTATYNSASATSYIATNTDCAATSATSLSRNTPTAVTVSTTFTPFIPLIGAISGAGYQGAVPVSRTIFGHVLAIP